MTSSSHGGTVSREPSWLAEVHRQLPQRRRCIVDCVRERWSVLPGHGSVLPGHTVLRSSCEVGRSQLATGSNCVGVIIFFATGRIVSTIPVASGAWFFPLFIIVSAVLIGLGLCRCDLDPSADAPKRRRQLSLNRSCHTLRHADGQEIDVGQRRFRCRVRNRTVQIQRADAQLSDCCERPRPLARTVPAPARDERRSRSSRTGQPFDHVTHRRTFYSTIVGQ
jgi:hypothetical protein